MAAIISCHQYSFVSTSPFKQPIHSKLSSTANYTNFHFAPFTNNAPIQPLKPLRCSQTPPPFQSPPKQESWFFPSLKECAISIALAVGLLTGVPALANTTSNPALPDVSVLISGPPIKDPGALLRYALPIDNKAIREVQKPLEDITDSLKMAGAKALDSAERNVRQASRALKQGRTAIVSGLAKSKVDHGIELLNKLEDGMEELEQIIESKNREALAPKQMELLNYVGG